MIVIKDTCSTSGAPASSSFKHSSKLMMWRGGDEHFASACASSRDETAGARFSAYVCVFVCVCMRVCGRERMREWW